MTPDITASPLPAPPPVSDPGIRTDDQLRHIDVPAAITDGLADEADGPDRLRLFTNAAIAAALAAEDLHVGPYPLSFLARYIRTGGLALALQLPEPLIRPDQSDLVRAWMRAAEPSCDGIEDDTLFSQWLEMVVALLLARRKTRLSRIQSRSIR